MPMYKRILVPVDGSKTSDAALKEAVELARDQGAKLRIVYAIDEASIVAGSEYGDMLGAEKSQIDSGKRILEKANAIFPEAETRLLETERIGQGISEVIVQDAKAWGADLIVAGTHGRTGLRHLLMGSVAEGIVRISKVPVLLVRGGA